MTLTTAQVKKLREPFKAEQVGKLPRVWCRDCSQNKAQRHCGQHKLVKCQICAQKITEAHLHLDFVGHAHITNRLLDVDPDYEFESVKDNTGHPIAKGSETLYQMTISGSRKEEWGEGPNMKESSSDGIRRCAMRFGCGLELWAKEGFEDSSLQAGSAQTTDNPVEPPAAAPGRPARNSAATQTGSPPGGSPQKDTGAHASPKQEKLIRDLVAKIRKRDAEHTAVGWFDSQPPISEWPIVTVSGSIGRLQGALKALETAAELPPAEAEFVAKAKADFKAEEVPF